MERQLKADALNYFPPVLIVAKHEKAALACPDRAYLLISFCSFEMLAGLSLALLL